GRAVLRDVVRTRDRPGSAGVPGRHGRDRLGHAQGHRRRPHHLRQRRPARPAPGSPGAQLIAPLRLFLPNQGILPMTQKLTKTRNNTAEESQIFNQTTKGTPMGELLRRYWWPVGISADLKDKPT